MRLRFLRERYFLSLVLLSRALLSSCLDSFAPGKIFDRFVIVWLENTDFDSAVNDPNLRELAEHGITLTNYYATTHPQRPNFVAAVAGDHFGIDFNHYVPIGSNVSTVVDLLEDKNISWSEYSTVAATGGSYTDKTKSSTNDTAKRNSFVTFDSVMRSPDRLDRVKPLQTFQQDLEANSLPQWIFVSPNNGSTIWARNFVTPLLEREDFHFLNRTLVVLTFSDARTTTTHNRVYTLLLGDVVPEQNTSDPTFYTHYTLLSTLEENFFLHSLGRWDIGANIFSFLMRGIAFTNRDWEGPPPLGEMYFNYSYLGALSKDAECTNMPIPNTTADYAGRRVLPAIVDTYAKWANETVYWDRVEVHDGAHPPTDLYCKAKTT